MPNWQFNDVISLEDYFGHARQWVDLGAQLIGGCCGIGPDHIRLLRDGLPSHVPVSAKPS
jgi:S-methylmethionine-dependent homocysteine/selenocysteine methylase